MPTERPDTRPDSAKRIAAKAMEAIRLLDGATSRREVVSIHADWCEWAERNRVCQQIRQHLNDKAAGLRSQFGEAKPRDHKMASAGDR